MVAQPLRFAPGRFRAELDGRRPVQVLDDAAVEEDVPEPEPAEEPWDDFVARQRAREALQAAREAGIHDRALLERQDPRVNIAGRRVMWDHITQDFREV